jgi:hypothetical protein
VIILARINLDRIREESMTLDVTGHFNRPDLFDFRLKGPEEHRGSGMIGVVSEAGYDLPDKTESQVLLPPSPDVLMANETEILAPSGTDSAPAFRVITSSRSTSFESEIHELEKNG